MTFRGARTDSRRSKKPRTREACTALNRGFRASLHHDVTNAYANFRRSRGSLSDPMRPVGPRRMRVQARCERVRLLPAAAHATGCCATTATWNRRRAWRRRSDARVRPAAMQAVARPGSTTCRCGSSRCRSRCCGDVSDGDVRPAAHRSSNSGGCSSGSAGNRRMSWASDCRPSMYKRATVGDAPRYDAPAAPGLMMSRLAARVMSG